MKLFNLVYTSHLNIIRRLSLKDALINLGEPEMERQDIQPWPSGSHKCPLQNLTCKSQRTKEVTVATRPLINR